MNNSVTVFENKDEQYLCRVISKNEKIFFLAMDIAQALGFAKAQTIYEKLDKDEKMLLTPKSWEKAEEDLKNLNISNELMKKVWLINEAGLYNVILTCRKPRAKILKKWITNEVLPSVRSKGMKENYDFVLEQYRRYIKLINTENESLKENLKCKNKENQRLKELNAKLKKIFMEML